MLLGCIPEAIELGRPVQDAGLDLSRRFQVSSGKHAPPKGVLVQCPAEDRLVHALKVEEGEVVTQQGEGDGVVVEFAAQTLDGKAKNRGMVESER
jgi:hypothetical protein